jgi:hypothetical protein
MNTHPPALIRKREFLALVHVSPRYLDHLIARGIIPVVRVGKCVLIPRDEALARLTNGNPGTGAAR